MQNVRITVQPLTPIGAEIKGLDEGTQLSGEVGDALRSAWLEYGVLLFRNVQSISQHLAISRCFGELELHPLPEMRAAEDPLFMDIGGSKTPRPVVYDETELRVNRIPWHRDTAYTPNICQGAMLRMLEVPESEGETLVADTAAAYDDLSPQMKTLLEGLEYRATLRLDPLDPGNPGAFWKSVRQPTSAEFAAPPQTVREMGWPDQSRFPSVVHPAVLIHPDSHRKCLFLSPKDMDYFLGMERSDSAELLSTLVQHMTQPRYVYKHRWAVNDAVIWDNRRIIHAAIGNKPGERRRGLRTTLAGALHVGRYFDSNIKHVDEPLTMD